MRKNLILGATLLVAGLMAGCGGDSDNNNSGLNRVLVGFTYVKSAVNPPTGPDVLITASNTAPDGYVVPTAGSVTLSVADGELVGRAPGSYTRDLSAGNDIIVNASAKSPYLVTVAASGVTAPGGTAKVLSSYSEDLTTGGGDGTTKNMASPGSPTYTPGLPASMKITVNGEAPPTTIVSGGTYSLAIALFDVNGVSVPGVSLGTNLNVTSSDALRVAVGAGQTTLVPAAASSGLASGPVTITAAYNQTNLLTESFTTTFGYGTVTSVVVTPAGPTNMLWPAAAPDTTLVLTATVTNEFGAAVPGATVNWTSNKETSSGSNDWNTGSFDSTTAVFTANTGTTNTSGQVTTTVTTPTATAGPLLGNAAKGLANMTATCSSVAGFASVNITRPLGTITIAGLTGMDVNTISPSVGTDMIRVTGAADIDGDTVTAPAVTFQRTNTPGAGTVGNTGDTSPQSTSVATIDGATGVVTAHGTPGQVVVTATDGVVTSNALTIEIYGAPSKIVFAPDTAMTVIAGASGEYANSAGNTQVFNLSYMDAYGHTVPFGEISNLVTRTSISSSAAGAITNGGSNTINFTLTFGTADGTFLLDNTSGTWTGTHGGSAMIFLLNRTVGVNGS